jgi:hypothetical protein
MMMLVSHRLTPITGSLLVAVIVLLTNGPCQAQQGQREPHLGYVYPAGGQVGTEISVEVGGQYLDQTSEIHVSGGGIEATVVKHLRPMTPREATLLRDKLAEARKRLEGMRSGRNRGQRRIDREAVEQMALRMGVTKDELEALNKYREQRADKKRQLNPQIEETVLLKLKVDAKAELGRRELRLRTPRGLSNPVYFIVGQWPEHLEIEPNDVNPEKEIRGPFPAVLNGQIMPGDVDRFVFEADRGQQLVISVLARQLVPYLADAVPGWFQATIGLYDESGREVAYVDDFQMQPDPVLSFKIPRDGMYGLEIKDAIYRGREDFVYRVTVGETPYVTSIFPLGGKLGATARVQLNGWNLPLDQLEFEARDEGDGLQYISVERRSFESNRVPFAIDTMDECLEEEPNDELATAQELKPPLIVNGRINQPGDRDLYRFKGNERGTVAIEVLARRLNSPLDSLLKVTDSAGKLLAANDDFEDKGAGLTTHHADSMLEFKLPADGDYVIHLLDAQNHGGDAYGYRLRISARQRDFDLRVVPSSVNVRPGATVPLRVYALRRDGFSDEIELRLVDPPSGFKLSGAVIPNHQDEISVTLTVPSQAADEPYELKLEGVATVKGKEIRREVLPADDMMQAFIYHHLVTADCLLVSVSKNARRWNTGRGQGGGQVANALSSIVGRTVQIPAGGIARFEVPFPKSPNLDQVKLELKDPPEGITIQGVSAGTQGIAVIFAADAGKVRPGQGGNLILEAFVERTFARRDGKGKITRRIPVATVPAIGYKIKS